MVGGRTRQADNYVSSSELPPPLVPEKDLTICDETIPIGMVQTMTKVMVSIIPIAMVADDSY